MKKYLFLALSAVLVLGACKKNSDEPNPTTDNVNATIKETPLASDGISDASAYEPFLYTIKEGKLVERNSNDENPEIAYYEYKSDNIEGTVYLSPLPPYSFGYQLDKNGRIETSFPEPYEHYEYNKEGYLVKKTGREGYPVAPYSVTFTYAEGSLLKAEKTYLNGGQTVFTYNYSNEDVKIAPAVRAVVFQDLIGKVLNEVSEPFVGKGIFNKLPKTEISTSRYGGQNSTIYCYYDEKDSKGRITSMRVVKGNSGNRYRISYKD